VQEEEEKEEEDLEAQGGGGRAQAGGGDAQFSATPFPFPSTRCRLRADQGHALAAKCSTFGLSMCHWPSFAEFGVYSSPPLPHPPISFLSPHSMSTQSQPLSPLEQELADLLDEHPGLLGSGAAADDIASRVQLARAWLEELKQEAVQLRALAQSATATPAQRQQLKLSSLYISDCESIVAKHNALQRANVRFKLVIPVDGSVFRLNVKRDDHLKDIQIKRARFIGGVGEPGMRFAVPSQAHVVASKRLECSAVCAGCELEAVAASQPDPPAFVTVVSVKESEGLADHFDVLVCGDRVRLLPPAHAFGDVSNGDNSVPMMEKKDFQYWQRLEEAPAECGGWSEVQLKAWFETYKIERWVRQRKEALVCIVIECWVLF